MRWLFTSANRLVVVVLLVSISLLALLMLMLTIKVNRIERAAPVSTDPGVRRIDPGPTGPLATPEPPAPTESLSLPDQSITTAPPAFPKAGDPRAVAVEAVNEWLAWDFPGLEDNLLPGVLEEAQANPPARGVRVDGPARTEENGPTAATVRVPTTSGGLLVDLVVFEGKWMVEAMGWAR